MKAEKFNYTATETLHYQCPCCAAEWQTNKLPYCPNCEVKIQYAATQLMKEVSREGDRVYISLEQFRAYKKLRVEHTDLHKYRPVLTGEINDWYNDPDMCYCRIAEVVHENVVEMLREAGNMDWLVGIIFS